MNYRGVRDAVFCCVGPFQTSPVTTRRFPFVSSGYILVYIHFVGSNLSGEHSHFLPGYFGILWAVAEADPKLFPELEFSLCAIYSLLHPDLSSGIGQIPDDRSPCRCQGLQPGHPSPIRKQLWPLVVITGGVARLGSESGCPSPSAYSSGRNKRRRVCIPF